MRLVSEPFRAPRAGLVLLTALAVPARAEDAADCSGQPDLGRALRRAHVVAERRVPFIKTAEADPACPSLAPACRDTAYLVAGDNVIRGGSRGAFACATYVGVTGQTRSGWLPAGALADDPPAKVVLDDWVGTWTSGSEQTITVRRKGDRLAVSGTATYGARNPERLRHGGPDLAWTDGETGIVPRFSPGDMMFCSVRMRLLPPNLIAESTAACGGMNVTFGGVYRRER